MTIGNPEQDVCQPNDVIYNFTYNTFLGFNDTTTFNVAGLPAGATAAINPTTAVNDGTTGAITISGTNAVATGSYSFSFTGTSGGLSKTVDLTLNIYSDTLNSSILALPENGAIDVQSDGMLTWNLDDNAEEYLVEVSNNASFGSIIESATVLTNR
jgi:hypothetical protein